MSRRPALATNLGVAVVSLALFLAIIEVVLRLSGFSYVLYPEEIEFGQPNPVLMKLGFREDQDLLWTKPDHAEKLERLRDERPPLLLLGDSCTAFGTYDERLAERAGARGVDLAWGNLAVAGWSSYQGRRLVERDLVGLGPEVVTIYFGWNDHWIGFGIEDKNVPRVKRVFGSRLGKLRLAQLATKALVAWGARETAYPERVSLDDFRANLRAMVERLRDEGATPVLLTAPSSHRAGHEPESLGDRWLRDVSELVPLHRAYVEAVRDVAADTGAPLCDLAARANELPEAERAALFSDDGIHLAEPGNLWVAEQLDHCFARDDLWGRLGGASASDELEEAAADPIDLATSAAWAEWFDAGGRDAAEAYVRAASDASLQADDVLELYSQARDLETSLLGPIRAAHETEIWPRLEEFRVADLGLPGLTPGCVAECTEPAFDVDLAHFQAHASETEQRVDDACFDLLDAYYGGYIGLHGGEEVGWPTFFEQTWDYGGHSLLGSGAHLDLLQRIAALLDAEPGAFVRQIVTDARARLLRDILEGSDCSGLEADEAVAEIDRILASADVGLDDDDRAQLAERRDVLAGRHATDRSLEFGCRERRCGCDSG